MSNRIECEIGAITYTTENSLTLVQLMENLEEAIKKIGAKKVNEILSAVS